LTRQREPAPARAECGVDSPLIEAAVGKRDAARKRTPRAHAVQLMLTCCGEPCAPAAVKVTTPLCRMLLTVTVVFAPAASMPLEGVMVYPDTLAFALQESDAPPLSLTMICT
jgi:hypothetical protein